MAIGPVKVGIVGLGHVGAHVGNSLVLQGVADEIYLCDVNPKKLAAETQDLNDSSVFAPHRVRVVNCGADYEKLAQCDVIVNAVGHVTLSAVSRDGELYATTHMVRTFVGRIAAAGFKGFWVNVTNPNDVVVREIHRLSGLPASHVMGTGTCLDSARLKDAIALATNVSPESINAYMIGEHGFSEIAAWSNVSFAGKPLAELAAAEPERYGFDKAKLFEQALRGGYWSYAGKHCTEYAIANSAVRITRAIVHDEHVVLPVSAYLDGQYGQSGFFIGVPAMISAQGVEAVYELDLTDEEREGFLNSCRKVQDNYAKLPGFPAEDARKVPVVIPPDPEHDDVYAKGGYVVIHDGDEVYPDAEESAEAAK
ncbi:L-lactate dehydrogenase [Bifidobacterium sp. DSM 109958]|uniref:L-lactate dehydrogenase n=1 Tax=Bifidobacterium moraviense TaxID=2675323 RepID=A0A7Y0F2S9_9BIFI|nr:L-lactate dehydrogenase [Bifidobacterium sp. DSM 109958]NMN00991.1 L-lactate dehydrogenase [Bifidobacterium sp. DSM 109958]